MFSKSKDKRTIESPTALHPALHEQVATPGSSATKIRLCFLGTALVDALGGPAEFRKRFTFPFLTSMKPNRNFNLAPGVWTDDTSMMLCLATSIATLKGNPLSEPIGGFDELHQLKLYSRWEEEGFLSAIGRCFDIGNTIAQAIYIYRDNKATDVLECVQRSLSDDGYSGNGSLMRVIPIGLGYWRDASQAKIYARRSSITTHPSPMCIEACELWTSVVAIIMENTTRQTDTSFSKLDLLDHIANYEYTNNMLRQVLALPTGIPVCPKTTADSESWYFTHHPLLRIIRETQAQPVKDKSFPYAIPSEDRLPSTGYVLHTLVAALYCFFATQTFEEGALMAVNLGSDADTVGAVYAGLAACWYGAEEGNAGGLFWTERVREWRKMLVRRDMVEQVAENFVAWEHRQSQHLVY